MNRNKEQTQKRIFEALATLLSQGGFRDIGINAIAREAGCDKVLIYRYFGGLEGLLREFAANEDVLPDISQAPHLRELAATGSYPDLAKAILSHFSRELRKKTMLQEIMRWEMIERNELTDAIADERERQGVTLLDTFGPEMPYDLPAVASILSAGITYLALRSKTADVYNGIDLTSDEGWQRIEDGVNLLIDRTFSVIEEDQP